MKKITYIFLLSMILVSSVLAISPCRFQDICQYGSIEEISLAIQDGKNVNQIDPMGFTPLYYAVSAERDTAIIKLLVSAGADLNLQDPNGDTALILSAKLENSTLSNFLVKLGADKEIRNNERCRYSDYKEKDPVKTGSQFYHFSF